MRTKPCCVAQTMASWARASVADADLCGSAAIATGHRGAGLPGWTPRTDEELRHCPDDDVIDQVVTAAEDGGTGGGLRAGPGSVLMPAPR